MRRCGPRLLAVAIFAMTCSVFTLGACPQPALPRVESFTTAEARARLERQGQRRLRMTGLIKARLPGLQGVVMNADVDVAAEVPGRLSVAVRSFFEAPAQVLVTDGDAITLYDASSGAPVFFAGRASDRALERVLQLPLLPIDAVDLVLGRAPLATSTHLRVTGVAAEQGTWEASLENEGRGRAVLTLRLLDDAVLAWRAFRPDGRPLLSARLEDLRTIGDVAFAHRIRIDVEADGDKPARSLVLEARDVTWNGPPLPDEAFHLEPPAGMTAIPL